MIERDEGSTIAITCAPLFLASTSPRRQVLLRQLGIPFSVLAPDTDESIHANELADDYVLRLAQAKAAAGARQSSERANVMGADTVVVCDDVILGKPQNDSDAAIMLRRLSGRTHDVLTALALRGDWGAGHALSRTRVFVKPLSDEAIARYIATGEPRGKAGAYAIQGVAAAFIERIEGSYSGVMGLPLFETAELLAKAGYVVP